MKPRCYPTPGPHYGVKNWDEGYWLDPFVCTGCGFDFAAYCKGEKIYERLYGRRYDNVIVVGYFCGCERTRSNMVLLDDDDCIAAHHTVSEDDLITYWPRIADFYIGDEWNDDPDDGYDAVEEERELWPELIRKYHRWLESKSAISDPGSN